LLFSWNGLGHSVSIVLDASGMLDNLGAATLSGPTSIIAGVGALPASNGTNLGTFKAPVFLPLGPIPLAARTLNTGAGCDALTLATQVSPTSITTNQPNVDTCMAGMVDDGVPGDPMASEAFSGFNANFDFSKLVVAKMDGVYAPPSVIYTSPAVGETLILTGTTVNFSFVNPMQADTVVFSLKDAGNNTVNGTLSPNTGTSRHFTFTPTSALSEPFTYTATISSGTDENGTLLGPPVAWSFNTGLPPAPGACTPTPQVPVGSNFTMLAGNGGLDQGTNDVTFSLDQVNLNTTVDGTNGITTNTLASPTQYYGALWTAHHIRLFGQGTWEFNSGCRVDELEQGTHPDDCAVQGARLSMTVAAGQIGAHMLFDWKDSANIDVLNVWNQDAAWNDDPDDGRAATNDMWAGDGWAGPAGVVVNPNTTWQLVSTDPDGDNINGVKMVDGPFIGFNANFNLGAADSCLPGALTVIEVEDIVSASGCSISRNPAAVNVLDKADWLLVGGFLAWLGVLRKRFKRQTQS
jgi:hypothetical protein